MTTSPLRAASWTTKLPTPPVAPTTRTTSPAVASIASRRLSAAAPASGSAAAASKSEPGRLGGEDQLRPADDIFREGPALERRHRRDEAEHLVAHREVAHLRTDRLDDAREGPRD